MLADRVRMGNYGKKEEIEYIGEVYLAQDDDFVKINGRWIYQGSELEIEIPHIIQGERVTSYEYMFNGTGSYLATPVTRVDSNNQGVTNMRHMFSGSSATSLDLSNFDTSNVTNMSNMFSGFSATSLDVSSFDTSSVTNMSSMFRDCRGLNSLDLSTFDTSEVINMSYMFYYNSSTSLDLSNFDTSNVIDMSGMFELCQSLTSLDLSSFDTSKVTSMSQMFRYSTSITTAYARTQGDADKFNSSSNKPSNVNFVVKPEAKPEDIADENCQVATDDDFSGTTDGNFRYIGTATRLVIPHVIKGVEVTSYAEMFENSNVTEVRSNNSNVTDMNGMFTFCSSTSLDLSNFDTSNVTNMEYMFVYCQGLTSLDLSNFDTSNVTDMRSMFYYCQGLISLDLSGFNTSHAPSIGHMFFNCTSIITAYAKTQADADTFNNSSGKPSNVNFVVKP